MPARPNPTADLARMYRERIPTSPTKSIGRMGPVSVGRGGLSLNPLPALGSVVRWLRDQPGTNVSTPVNVGGGVSMGGQGGASQLIFDPTARAVERAVGDVTAIPGIGEPSPSYTAEQIRQQGVIPGVLGAAMDYSMFLPGAIKAVRGVRGATADAAERLAQGVASREMGIATSALPERPTISMQSPTLADRPTVYMRNQIYDPNPLSSPSGTIGINEIDDILADIRASRGRSTPSQLPGVVEPTTSGMPRGVYAVDNASGDVTLYQVDDAGNVQGKLEMARTMDGFTVVGLSANPGSPAVSNLLAGAKITADLNFPGVQYPLSPSANLSQYSRPIVEKLQAAGMIDPNYVLPPSRLLNAIDRPWGLEAPIPIQDVPRLVGISPEQIRSTSRALIRALAEAKRQGRISPDTITRTAQLRSELASRMAAAGMTPATPGASPSMPVSEMLIGNEYYAVPRGFELSPLFRDVLAKQDQFYLPGIIDELGDQYVYSRWNNPYDVNVG